VKTIEVKGLDSLLAKLDGIADDSLIDKGIARTASLVQSQAKLSAPAAEQAGGDLQDSIKVRKVKDRTAEVYTGCDHAIFNEYGTGTKGDPEVSHTTKKSWTYMGTDGQFHTTHGMEPRPFMRPAARAGEEQMEGIFGALIRKELEK